MSYDKMPDRNRRSARQWAQEDSEDKARGFFLAALGQADFEVTDFEAQFIGSFLSSRSPSWWTPARRATCDKMRQTYGGRL